MKKKNSCISAYSDAHKTCKLTIIQIIRGLDRKNDSFVKSLLLCSYFGLYAITGWTGSSSQSGWTASSHSFLPPSSLCCQRLGMHAHSLSSLTFQFYQTAHMLKTETPCSPQSSPAVTDRMMHIFRKLLTDHLPERLKLLMWTWNFARLKLSWKCRKQQASTISNSHLWATLIKLSHCDIWMKEPILNTPISSPLYINA